MLFIPGTTADAKALHAAVARGRLRRIARRLYTDDLERPIEGIIQAHLLAILGALFNEEWHVSHSTAALLRARDGQAFISGTPRTYTPYDLPGVRVHRLRALPYPEVQALELDEPISTSLSADSIPARVRISSPLQTVFEVLSEDARQPARTLPEPRIRGLIEALSEGDRVRAEAFAKRNRLNREWARFERLLGELRAAAEVRIARPAGLDAHFYDWRVGRLEALSGREFRFNYDADWTVPLTAHLPLREHGPSYEGPRLPPFFENLLPEGWTEAKLRAVHKLSREDEFGLLRTTQRYLSNLTLRPESFDASRLVLDHLQVRLDDVAPDRELPLEVAERIGEAPESTRLWLELRRRGATRLSGVQAKLPVHLGVKAGEVTLDLGGHETTTTHILKLPSDVHPQLVENEWATMELARRVGLPVPPLRRVRFPEESPYRGPGLLVERFDIPRSLESPEIVFLLEDAASLLGLRREEKYTPSLERVASALADVGLTGALFFDHVVFSWLVGNGDLHAKNISVLRAFEPGRLGRLPEPVGVGYSPLYDLVNTRLVLRDDLFALPVNGRQNHLRARDFLALADRRGWERRQMQERIERLVSGIRAELEGVLELSGLSEERRETYREIVESNIAGL